MNSSNPDAPGAGGGEVSIADAQPIEATRSGAILQFPTVAVGASAGGVEALRRLFAAMPADSGCAFVVVTHLSPDRESMLSALIGRTTTMLTIEVHETTPLERNRIYVAPPRNYLEVRQGRLQLRPMDVRTPRAVAVDHLMISLAADQREHAIGIVLSGADGDGSVGVKAIKSEGGFTIAQLPASAAHPGMPEHAVATGSIDAQLSIEDMPGAIVGYLETLSEAPVAAPDHTSTAAAMTAILDTLRASCGLDFRGYKPSMLQRRVRRRMALRRMREMTSYADSVASDTEEAAALANDFLINVTEFFREPESWEALAEEILPGLLDSKDIGDAVRIWVPGCATGEEAYTVAMLVLEQPAFTERALKLQVFGTDVDHSALAHARKGRYALSIEASVRLDRLRRFFFKNVDGYQVRKELRECVTFAPQNLINDPPFSHMDLVSCRNFLIYVEPSVQRQILRTLHFAIDPQGYLALGKSETVAPQPALFTAASTRARIFRPVESSSVIPAGGGAIPGWRTKEVGRPSPSPGADLDYGKIVRAALSEESTSAAILTNREGHIFYFRGPLQEYLRQPDGLPTMDLFAMIDTRLRPQMRVALHKAQNTGERVEAIVALDDDTDDGRRSTKLVVIPIVRPHEPPLLLVTFERFDRRAEQSGCIDDNEATALAVLEEELRSTKRDLRAAIEELESTNEELKVANEEAMSMNEELQSSNEELETSKEELESINEELTTVNQQLEQKVLELEIVNDDIGNLLTSTHIPTLFLDRQLHVKRFTPAATSLFKLLPSDVDRPLTDLASYSDLPSLVDDVRR
ncbi:MAG: CheR family methyltransferase, partial [Betaproteobacteria bacterium]